MMGMILFMWGSRSMTLEHHFRPAGGAHSLFFIQGISSRSAAAEKLVVRKAWGSPLTGTTTNCAWL